VKPVGLVGGIGPESTIDYYRAILAASRERHPDGRAPSVVINSIDAKRMLDLFAADDRAGAAEYLTAEVERLARAGVAVDCSPPTRRTSSSTKCRRVRRFRS
jgi:aspartate racemase